MNFTDETFIQCVPILSEISDFDVMVTKIGQISKAKVFSWSLMMHKLF